MHYLFLAEGFEEIEAITPADVLRRAGIALKTVSVGKSLSVKGAHGIAVNADIMISDIKDGEKIQLIILPGGMPGTNNLAASKELADIINAHKDKSTLAAICAAPLVYGRMGLLKGKKATCFPGFEDELLGAHVSGDRVVVDGNMITSKGPGTAIDFSLKLVELLVGKDKAASIRNSMQVG